MKQIWLIITAIILLVLRIIFLKFKIEKEESLLDIDKEIKDFYALCQTFDVDVVEYSRLTNWGTWRTDEFQGHDVFNPAHPEFNQAKLAIDSVKNLPGTWFAGL